MRRLLSSLGRALVLPLALAGCGEAGDDGLQRTARPGIDVDEMRCGPVEVTPIGRAERLLPLPNGEVYLVGNSYNRFRQPSGKVIQFDPTGAQLPLVHTLGWPVMAVTLTDAGLVTAMDKASFYRWPETDFEHPERVVSVGGIQELTALDLAHTGWGDLVSGVIGIAEGQDVPALMRVDPETSQMMGYWPYVNERGQPVVDGQFTGIVGGPDGDIIAVGSGLDIRDSMNRVGFVIRLDLDVGRVQSVRQHPQDTFEPLRLVRDHEGRPTVLALEGHEGLRYENARPFLARFDEQGDLVDKIAVPLPKGTSQGAILAAQPMPDGGWLLGGSACGEARTWCQAWLTRLDRFGAVQWSRMVPRDVAATVNDLIVVGTRLFAAISSSYYCCEFDELDYDGWLWELDLEGNCPLNPGLKADGAVFR